MHTAPTPACSAAPRLLILSLAALTLTACITDNPSSTVESDAATDMAGADDGVDAGADARPPECAPGVEVDRDRIDFAPTPPFETRTERIRVSNPGACAATLQAVLLNGARAFDLRINDRDPRRDPGVLDDPDADGVPGLAAGASFDIEVLFTPPDEAAKAGELTLLVDGDEVRVPLSGNLAGPCFTVEPSVLEFTAGLNESQTAELTVTSCGSAAVTVHSAVFADDGDDAFTLVAERSTALPFDLAPADSPGGTALRLTVRFTPTQPGAVNSRLIIAGVDVPTREVRLVGRAQQNACPIAVLPPEPVFADVGEAVTLDGSASRDPDGPDGRPVQWRWRVTQAPDGSTAEPVETIFDPERPGDGGPLDDDETPGAVFVPVVAGQYTLELEVTDLDGLTSTACNTNATMVIRVGVERRVVVQLTWLTPGDLNPNDAIGADVDLRLSQGELICTPAEPTPDWPPAGPANNPVYDADAQAGPGPENIILTQPTHDEYGVTVTYDDDGGLGPSVATVRIFVDDRLVQTEVFELLQSGDGARFSFMLP